MDKLMRQLILKADDILKSMGASNDGRIDRHMLNAELNQRIRMNKEINRMILRELIKTGRVSKKRNYIQIENQQK
jgi:hypothetical protein